MAIVSFWSGSRKETGQTLSISAVATQMALEHNYKILLIDATFADDVMERCFWNIGKTEKKKGSLQNINKGKMDISSGAEGLVSAVASNKATPEIITNFTRVVFRNRLDVVCGLKTQVRSEYLKSIMLYKDLLKAADKYYDIVLVDLEKSLNEDVTKVLLENSHVIVYNFTKNLRQAEEYREFMDKYPNILKPEKVIPLLSNSDENTPYNRKNVTRFIGEKKLINAIEYNTTFLKAASEAGLSQFFISAYSSKNDKNGEFVKGVEGLCVTIVNKLKELKYKV